MKSASVDLISADPPFNSNADYAAPIGSTAVGAAFQDTWGLDAITLAWCGEIKPDSPGLYDLLTAVRPIPGDSLRTRHPAPARGGRRASALMTRSSRRRPPTRSMERRPPSPPSKNASSSAHPSPGRGGQARGNGGQTIL